MPSCLIVCETLPKTHQERQIEDSLSTHLLYITSVSGAEEMPHCARSSGPNEVTVGLEKWGGRPETADTTVGEFLSTSSCPVRPLPSP